MAIIQLNNLTKEYRLGTLTNIKSSLRNLVSRPSKRSNKSTNKFLALKNINLQINEGEVVGIIGTNGAGKSTLLKHLANITKPTSGQIFVNGTVAPLIEVGAGLNPELTGRENIFLNAAILGVPKRKIRQQLDSIVKFAELDQFIDTPVKRYSSGMTVRLGFAIATSISADILIVDEVLAVGDLAFQRKCFDRMEQLIKQERRTVLLVSHNIRQILRMCSRVVLLDKGEILYDGDPDTACQLFYERSNKKIQRNNALCNNAMIETTGEIELINVEIIGINELSTFKSNDPLHIRITFKVTKELVKPEIIIGTHTTDFIYLSTGSTQILEQPINFKPGNHTVDYIIEAFPLTAGNYAIRFAVFSKDSRLIFNGENLKFFTVSQVPAARSNAPTLKLLELSSKWSIDDTNVY